jgi:hypothetical protein
MELWLRNDEIPLTLDVYAGFSWYRLSFDGSIVLNLILATLKFSWFKSFLVDTILALTNSSPRLFPSWSLRSIFLSR